MINPIWKRIYDSIIALILISSEILSWISDPIKWNVFLGLTYWSHHSLLFYFIAISIFEWLTYFNITWHSRYEEYAKNSYLKIAMPYSMAVVILFRLLILFSTVWLEWQ